MNLLKRLFKRNNYPGTTYQTEYAFSSGGNEYYQLTDFNNMPALRGMKTMVFFEEMRMRCDREYLLQHVEAVSSILNKPNINIFDIHKLNEQLKQRLNIAIEMELVYKLASVVFFDKKENITDYDYAFNKKKMEHWKKHEANAFFLLKPVQALVPALKDIEGNLESYLIVQEELNKLHLENLLLHLPERKTPKSNGSSSTSAKTTFQRSAR